jgi:excinuclease ABC subunit B
VEGHAILYADVMTDSMRRALSETGRRRQTQLEYNDRNHITPQSIIKPIDMSLVAVAEGDYVTVPLEAPEEEMGALSEEERERLVKELEERMREAARRFEFEQAAQLRDRVKALKSHGIYGDVASPGPAGRGPG